jgi:hypothetical protein
MRIANHDSVGGDGIGGAAHDGSAGRRTGTVFYSFDLDKVVPPDYLVRQIDSLLDQSWVELQRIRPGQTSGIWLRRERALAEGE